MKLERIVEGLFLGPSHHSIGLQCADLVVAITAAAERGGGQARGYLKTLLPRFARHPGDGRARRRRDQAVPGGRAATAEHHLGCSDRRPLRRLGGNPASRPPLRRSRPRGRLGARADNAHLRPMTPSVPSPQPRDLVKGKVALVTGGGPWDGTRHGPRPRRPRRAGHGRRQNGERAPVAAEAPVEILAESVATEEGCRRIVDETRRLGPISILVNNAGVGSYHERPIWEQDPEVWRETMAVNLDGPFHLTRLAAPDMVEERWGGS